MVGNVTQSKSVWFQIPFMFFYLINTYEVSLQFVGEPKSIVRDKCVPMIMMRIQ